MRGTVDGLPNAHPIGMQLPGLFHDDDFAQRFTAGLDDVLAPVLMTLDAIEAYADPWTAPLDFVEWLGQWVGVDVDPRNEEVRQRRLVAHASEMWKWSGTARGLADMIEVQTGVRPEIEESGGSVWGALPGNELPGTPEAAVTVRLRVADVDAIDRLELERGVASIVPAHVTTTIEVIAQ